MRSSSFNKLARRYLKKIRKTVTWSYLLRIAVLALIYIVAAKLGLSFAYSTEQVTVIWPPTGIALAVLLIFGYRYWPGIFIGAFIANFLTNETAPVAIGIAAGNTLEALAGSYLLRRFIRFDGRFSYAIDFFGLLVLAGCISTAISATIGTTTLALGNVTSHSYLSTWLVWWVGDMMGAIVFAPLVLIYFKTRYVTLRRMPLEASLLLVVTAVVCLLIFSNNHVSDVILPYLIFPLIIWASLRFQQAGAVVIVVLVAAIAIWGTVAKVGPFDAYDSIEKNLILLQTFVLVVATTAMLTAIIADRHQKAERALMRRNNDLKEANRRVMNLLSGAIDETPNKLRKKVHTERKRLREI